MPNPQDLSSYDNMENPFAGLLGQQGGGQPAPQGQPTPQQGGGQEAALQQALQAAQGAQGGPEGLSGPAQEPQAQPNQSIGAAEAQGVAGQGQAVVEDQLSKGQNPDNLKPLIGATQNLEKYINTATSKEDIILARGIISAISRLMGRTQDEQMSQLG